MQKAAKKQSRFVVTMHSELQYKFLVYHRICNVSLAFPDEKQIPDMG